MQCYNSYHNLTFLSSKLWNPPSYRAKVKSLIPRALRDAHHWQEGQELLAINTDDGILLKPKKSFLETKLKEVAGCLSYEGEAKTLDELDNAIRQGVLKQWQ